MTPDGKGEPVSCQLCGTDLAGDRGPICDTCLDVMLVATFWPTELTAQQSNRLTLVRQRVAGQPELVDRLLEWYT